MENVLGIIEYPDNNGAVIINTGAGPNDVRAVYYNDDASTGLQKTQDWAKSVGATLYRLWPTQSMPNHDDDVALWQFDWLVAEQGSDAAIAWYNKYATQGGNTAADGTFVAPPMQLKPAEAVGGMSMYVIGALVLGAIWLVSKISKPARSESSGML